MVTRSDALSIYIPKSKAEHRLLERLATLAKRKDRSINYLIVDAVLEYLEQQEDHEPIP
jgi:predicted transcriptional regulator